MNLKHYTIVATSVLVFSGCMAQHYEAPHWGYEGKTGPAHWGEVSEVCSQGHSQSPINIVTASVSEPMSENIVEIKETKELVKAHIEDNGHTIKVAPKCTGGMKINDVKYKLLQFHFHGKSENTIDGKQFEMELHFVHQNKKGELAVVGVMIEEGAHNKAFEGIISNIYGGDIDLVPNDFLPKNITNYYHFIGSLTTPPCSEDVKWFVLKEPITVDKEQLGALRQKYKNNYRPVQARNGRVIEVH